MARQQKIGTFKLAFFLVSTIMAISFAFYGYQITNSPNILVDKESRVIIIGKDMTFKELQDALYKGGYVNDLVSFSFLSKLMNYSENIKPGRFLLERNMNNMEAIRRLRAGDTEPVNITFNNIRTIQELGSKITKNLLMTEEEFNAALTEYLGTNDLGFTSETVISLFIPNTYEVYYSTTAKDLIERMEREYRAFWNEDRIGKAEKTGLSMIEVSTLASIVQGETMKADEKSRVAGLYLNRLRKNMLLQADPTVKFAVNDFSLKRVLKEHTEVDSPYNTYKYAGLPPGPINMPSISSIDAVLNFESHNYVYMCAKEDFSGYHNFAVNYDEHLINARKYQRQLTIEQRIGRERARNNQ